MLRCVASATSECSATPAGMKGVWERSLELYWSLLICDREMGDGKREREREEIVREEMCRAHPQHEICNPESMDSKTDGQELSSFMSDKTIQKVRSKGHNQLMRLWGCNKYPIIICVIVSRYHHRSAAGSACLLVMIFNSIVVFLQPSDTVSLFLFVCFYDMLNTSYYPIYLSRFCSFSKLLSTAMRFPSFRANI